MIMAVAICEQQQRLPSTMVPGRLTESFGWKKRIEVPGSNPMWICRF